jgi:hypothetical protein
LTTISHPYYNTCINPTTLETVWLSGIKVEHALNDFYNDGSTEGSVQVSDVLEQLGPGQVRTLQRIACALPSISLKSFLDDVCCDLHVPRRFERISFATVDRGVLI